MPENTTTTTNMDAYRVAGDELLAAQRALSRALSAAAGLSFDAKAKCYRRLDLAYKVYGETEARVINERSKRCW